MARLYGLFSLSIKERAKFLKGIENARDFFKDLGCANASKVSDDLELKLLRSHPELAVLTTGFQFFKPQYFVVILRDESW